MQKYPDSLLAIAKEAATIHGQDRDKATDWAWRQWTKQRDYADFTEALAKRAVRELIADSVHETNEEIRRDAGVYGQKAKVSAASAEVNRIETVLYLDSYSIGTRILGDIEGKELPSLANSEQAKADGSAFNARLCLRLAEIVPAEKHVRDCVSEGRLRKLFRELAKSKRRVILKRREKAVA
jgi:hypothetical protein